MWQTKCYAHIKQGKNYDFNIYVLLSKPNNRRLWVDWEQAIPEFNTSVQYIALKRTEMWRIKF